MNSFHFFGKVLSLLTRGFLNQHVLRPRITGMNRTVSIVFGQKVNSAGITVVAALFEWQTISDFFRFKWYSKVKIRNFPGGIQKVLVSTSWMGDTAIHASLPTRRNFAHGYGHKLKLKFTINIFLDIEKYLPAVYSPCKHFRPRRCVSVTQSKYFKNRQNFFF